jgi:hypothetical protein
MISNHRWSVYLESLIWVLHSDERKATFQHDSYDDHGHGHGRGLGGNGGYYCHGCGGGPERSEKIEDDSPFPRTPLGLSMNAIGERERHRGWKRCSYSHVSEAEGRRTAVGRERLNGIRGLAGPTWHLLERTTFALRIQIQSTRVILEGEHQAGDRWELEEFGAKAQTCAARKFSVNP